MKRLVLGVLEAGLTTAVPFRGKRNEPAFLVRGSNITPDRETGIGGWSDVGALPRNSPMPPRIVPVASPPPATIAMRNTEKMRARFIRSSFSKMELRCA